jgi:hypothetical protein
MSREPNLSARRRGAWPWRIGRLLVLAGAALTDLEELPSSVGRRIDAADEVLVVTPATSLPTTF